MVAFSSDFSKILVSPSASIVAAEDDALVCCSIAASSNEATGKMVIIDAQETQPVKELGR